MLTANGKWKLAITVACESQQFS